MTVANTKIGGQIEGEEGVKYYQNGGCYEGPCCRNTGTPGESGVKKKKNESLKEDKRGGCRIVLVTLPRITLTRSHHRERASPAHNMNGSDNRIK